jgi:GNAT superfamily N-acetyltransferase
MINEHEGHIRGMAVLPFWQGVGIAGQLLKLVESELWEKGCSVISLDKSRKTFYEKSGFRPTGKITDFFGMPLFEYVKPLPSKSRPWRP